MLTRERGLNTSDSVAVDHKCVAEDGRIFFINVGLLAQFTGVLDASQKTG